MGSALSRRGRHFRPRRGRHFRAPIGTSNVVLGLRLFMALAIGAATLTAATASSRPASASPNYTFTNETFQEPSFPPAGWQAEFSDFGPWAAHCPAVTPATGCSAQASATSGAAGMDRLLFNGTSPIPSDLTNVTLSFYSDFTTDATTSGDTAMVGQASVNGSSGDFNFLATVFGTGPNQTNDPSGTPTLHTIPLTSLNLPLAFMWSSPGDTAASPTKTWAISNVVISGTLPATTLTANPIPNTQYHVVAGTPITLTLTGSSNPAGDPLNFAITTPPTVGTLGAITPVNSTSATVVYTAPTTSCPDPNGTPGVICPDSFKFDVSDGGGNVSSPANVALDVNPGGAGGQQVVITAPASENYVTIGQPGGGTTQGADLSGAVSVGPSNFPDEIELHVQAATGTIDLHNAAASGVVFTNGTSSPGTEIDMKGSAAKINTAVGLFQYFPPSGTTPTTTIKLFADDLGATGQGNFTVQTQATVNINGPNNSPAPVLSLPTGNEAIATNAGPLTFPPGAATGISFADAGATGTTQDTVPLGVSGGTLAFPAADTSGGTQLVTVTGNGSSSLTVVGTVAHLNQALADLTFDPSGLPSETVTFTAQVFDPDTT
ncbi:MAG TPA: hypothetical protein VNY84_07070, partial [Acidimicrobiales bacterium]|nr:hypothetical protein [Acidimicrobiales bacterium]